MRPGCATDRGLKILSVQYFKNQNSWSLKKCFHVLFHVMITDEVPVTLLQAYLSLPQHTRKGMLIRWINTSDLCTAVGCQQFCKESRKLQRRTMLELNYSFNIIVVVLQLRDVPKTVI